MTTAWDDEQPPDEDDLARAKANIVGEVPMMTQPPDRNVTLFRGLWQNQVWRNDAEVRELSGEDEEIIARALSGDDPSGFIDAMLQQGVQRIGTLDLFTLPPVERLVKINQLLIGEKELLFLQILMVTFGDERTVTTTCPSCKADMDVSFSITEDIPIRTMEDMQRLTYEFKLRDGSTLEYRLVTGEDQYESSRKRGSVLPEQNTIILSRCITTMNGRPLVDPLHFARSMGAGDRRKLLADINSHQPGPYFEEVKLPCAECGVEASFIPAWADLL